MRSHLTEEAKITRVMNAVAAGTTDQNSSSVDMAGFDEVTFIALFGTLTASQVTKLLVQQSDDDGSSDDFTTIATGTALADGDSNKLAISVVARPAKRYVRAVIDRGTANAVIDGVVAIQRFPRDRPVTQGSTVAVSQTSVSPSE